MDAWALGDRLGGLANRVGNPDGSIERHWFELLVGGAALLLVVATTYQFARDPFHIHKDSALFQHAGWYISEGATLYVDIWDLKPPLIYAVTTALAVLTGGNVEALHVASIALAVGAVVAGVAVVGLLVHRLTGDALAALVGGATVFVVPSIYTFPSAGIRPKYFAFLFGATALLLAVEDRPAASGAAAAIDAAFWQLGGPLALLVVAMGFQRGGIRGLARAVGGGAAVAVAVVAPFVLADLTIPLFLETVLAPVYGVERYTVASRLLDVVVNLGYGTLLIPIGIYGWSRGIAADARRYWWVAVGGSIYLLAIFVEFQGAIELVLLLPFLSIGVGLLIAAAPLPDRRWLLVGVVALLAVTSLYWSTGPVTPIKDEVVEAQEAAAVPTYESLPPDPPGVPAMETIYWEKLKPEICHYRLGHKQKAFARWTGESLTTATCGEWPFDRPPAQWLLDALVPG